MYGSLLMLLMLVAVCESRNRTTLDDMMNVCIDGRYHKTRASPEPGLHETCAPWSDLSCCSANVTKQLRLQDKWYNFGYDHCAGHTMSDKCREHFTRDLCLYECSPNVGPWIAPDVRKIRNEKFFHAPLCKSECDAWWNDCKEDWTCIQNWGKDFKWNSDGNQCPEGKPCQKFDAIFGNATTFCEVVWNYSWSVVPDDEPCMKISFKGSNPNRKVAEYYAKKKLGLPSGTGGFGSSLVTVFAALMVMCAELV